MATKLNPGQHDCYGKALPGEPMFTLLARDQTAPEMVHRWADRRAALIGIGVAPESDGLAVMEARECARSMAHWRRLHAEDAPWRKAKTTYALGFLFSADFSHVVLQRKKRPAFAAGKLNGIGGKMEAEDGGDPRATMRREWKEETGSFDARMWHDLAHVVGPDFHVICYFSTFEEPGGLPLERLPYIQYPPPDDGFEPLYVFPVADALTMPGTMGNLRVLLSIALDSSGIVRPVMLSDYVSNTGPK